MKFYWEYNCDVAVFKAYYPAVKLSVQISKQKDSSQLSNRLTYIQASQIKTQRFLTYHFNDISLGINPPV